MRNISRLRSEIDGLKRGTRRGPRVGALTRDALAQRTRFVIQRGEVFREDAPHGGETYGVRLDDLTVALVDEDWGATAAELIGRGFTDRPDGELTRLLKERIRGVYPHAVTDWGF